MVLRGWEKEKKRKERNGKVKGKSFDEMIICARTATTVSSGKEFFFTLGLNQGYEREGRVFRRRRLYHATCTTSIIIII